MRGRSGALRKRGRCSTGQRGGVDRPRPGGAGRGAAGSRGCIYDSTSLGCELPPLARRHLTLSSALSPLLIYPRSIFRSNSCVRSSGRLDVTLATLLRRELRCSSLPSLSSLLPSTLSTLLIEKLTIPLTVATTGTELLLPSLNVSLLNNHGWVLSSLLLPLLALALTVATALLPPLLESSLPTPLTVAPIPLPPLLRSISHVSPRGPRPSPPGPVARRPRAPERRPRGPRPSHSGLPHR